MRAYGYDWSQAIVTRLEAATRPTRLNELADLALLFEVPAMELLGFGPPEDFDAAEREIGELLTTHTRLREELSVLSRLLTRYRRGPPVRSSTRPKWRPPCSGSMPA